MFIITKDLSHKPHASKNMRLCNDDWWRDWCHIGSTGDCIKFYHKKGWADKKAQSIGGTVVEIPKGYSINVAGQIEMVDH